MHGTRTATYLLYPKVLIILDSGKLQATLPLLFNFSKIVLKLQGEISEDCLQSLDHFRMEKGKSQKYSEHHELQGPKGSHQSPGRMLSSGTCREIKPLDLWSTRMASIDL